jgi:hypothetical protein
MWDVWVSPEVKERQETGRKQMRGRESPHMLHGVVAAERTTTQGWKIVFQWSKYIFQMHSFRLCKLHIAFNVRSRHQR